MVVDESKGDVTVHGPLLTGYAHRGYAILCYAKINTPFNQVLTLSQYNRPTNTEEEIPNLTALPDLVMVTILWINNLGF